jgi:anaerobic ribonucleoside-triphosphate reductase activating protein
MDINYSGFLERSTVNGPGLRTVVWVQGCPIRCKGCFNPDLWAFEPRLQSSTHDLARRIIEIDGIDGVTFSGGEPFAQAAALGELGTLLRDHGLNILTFTGFTYEELIRKARPSWNRLLAVTDLLVAGPFISGLQCHASLLGSLNQRLVDLSEIRGSGMSVQKPPPQMIEIVISPDGTCTATGFPEETFFKGFEEQGMIKQDSTYVSLQPS